MGAMAGISGLIISGTGATTVTVATGAGASIIGLGPGPIIIGSGAGVGPIIMGLGPIIISGAGVGAIIIGAGPGGVRRRRTVAAADSRAGATACLVGLASVCITGGIMWFEY